MASDKPIINSLLDTDFYKFTMGQFVWKNPVYRNTSVRYGFKCRTQYLNLAQHINEFELTEELQNVQDLSFTDNELNYLRTLGIFKEDYINFLSFLQLPDFNLEFTEDNIKIEAEGPWAEAIYWETFIMNVVNELYFKSILGNSALGTSKERMDFARRTGRNRLAAKTRLINQNHHITFSDFGTRRRFNRNWHSEVVDRLRSGVSDNQFLGTSNMALAKQFDLQPIGTMAHELFMVEAARNAHSNYFLLTSHNRILDEWYQMYGAPLSIALTDTFGTDFFFRDFTPQQAQNWHGLRQDSGDPLMFALKATQFYKQLGIDPQDKIMVFSDGLDIYKCAYIADTLNHRSQAPRYTFGIGTNLTNDVGLPAISIVVKPISVNGNPTVKLSDNLAKAQGPPDEVERYKELFKYSENFYEECKY